MSGDLPLVTVVIPVYDVEAYLGACLDSVLAQTHRELDVVVVDDGSTDGSPALCDAYAARDARVRVLHQANAGLSAARNAGLAAAYGDLVTFLDSDDWWEPTFAEALVAALEAHPEAGTAISTFARVPGSSWVAPFADTRLLTIGEAVGLFAGDHHTLFTISCAKLFRREFLADAPFPEGRLHEDEFTTHRVLLRAPTVMVPDPLYMYRQRTTGIVSSPLTPERLLDALEAAEVQAMDFLAAGHERAGAWAQDQAFRKRIRLIGLLAADGRIGERRQQAASLGHAARTEGTLPRPAPMRMLRRVARHSPGLAVRGFGAFARASSLRRAAVRGQGRT